MRAIRLFAAAALMLIGGGTAAQQMTRPAPAPIGSGAAGLMPSGAPGARPLSKQDVDTWLDGYLPYALKKGDIAGAVVVVVKDGQVLTQRGFGYADVARRTPVDPEVTLFRPGSVSKLFTWTAVMQQVEAGRIDLDADVNNYLDFRIPLKDGKPVTMRQLMTHTAGFEEHGKETMYHDPANLTSLDAYLKRSLPKRVFAPGTTPSYSNYATALAGHIVERVTQMSFDDYIEQRIFRPLGMAHSTFRLPLPQRFQQQMAQGYSVASAAEPSKYEIMSPKPAGALASSGADMAKFMLAHLNQGAGLMKPETARMMHDTPLTILPSLNRMELGFFETNINGRQVIAHLGDTMAFHTSLHLFMNDDVGFYVSFNSMGKDGAVGPLRRALFEDFADRYLPDTRPADGKVDATTAAEHARMMAGNYFKSRRSVTSIMAILNLPGQVSVGVDSKGGLVVPVARGLNGQPLKWVETAPFIWRAVDSHERLAAQVVDGKVARWSLDGVSPYLVFDRVPAWQSSAWLLPALYAGLAILLLTLLHWPVSALIRRHYKAPLALGRRSLLAYRGVRLGAGLVLALLGGWAIAFAAMTANLDNFTPRSDPWLWTLQILGVFIFVGGVAIAGWNLALATKEKRGWFGRLWAVLLLLSMLVVLYTAWMFGLLAMTVNY